MADEDTDTAVAAPVKAPAAKGDAKGKSKAAKDKGKGKKGAPTAAAGGGPSIAGHPRASRAVARAKGWGALGGFLIGGYLSLSTGTLADTALRALIAGAVCYLAAWAGSVFVWRRLVILEVKAREQQLLNMLQSQRARGEQSGGERPGARAA